MFTDPTTVSKGATVSGTGGTAIAMPRVSQTGYNTVYRSSDGLHELKFSHQRGARYRSEGRFDFNTTYVDPADGLTKQVSASAYLVLNRPQAGYTSVQLRELIQGVCAFLGTAANADKLIGFEG